MTHQFNSRDELLNTRIYVPSKGIWQLGEMDGSALRTRAEYKGHVHEATVALANAYEDLARAMDEAGIEGEVRSQAVVAEFVDTTGDRGARLVDAVTQAAARLEDLEAQAAGEDPWADEAVEVQLKAFHKRSDDAGSGEGQS